MSQKLLGKNEFLPHKYLPNFHFQSTRNRGQQRKMKKMSESTEKAEENEAKAIDSSSRFK